MVLPGWRRHECLAAPHQDHGIARLQPKESDYETNGHSAGKAARRSRSRVQGAMSAVVIAVLMELGEQPFTSTLPPLNPGCRIAVAASVPSGPIRPMAMVRTPA